MRFNLWYLILVLFIYIINAQAEIEEKEEVEEIVEEIEFIDGAPSESLEDGTGRFISLLGDKEKAYSLVSGAKSAGESGGLSMGKSEGSTPSEGIKPKPGKEISTKPSYSSPPLRDTKQYSPTIEKEALPRPPSDPKGKISPKDKPIVGKGRENEDAKNDDKNDDEESPNNKGLPNKPISPVSSPGFVGTGPKPIGPVIDPYAPGPHNGWGYYNEFNYPTRLARPRALSINEATTTKERVFFVILALLGMSIIIL